MQFSLYLIYHACVSGLGQPSPWQRLATASRERAKFGAGESRFDISAHTLRFMATNMAYRLFLVDVCHFPKCRQISKLASGDDDIVRRDGQPAAAPSAAPVAEQPAREGQASQAAVLSTREAKHSGSGKSASQASAGRDRSFSDTRSIMDPSQSADDNLRKRVALHNISVKIHRENLDQEYGLATPKRADQSPAAKPAMRRTRSWGDSLNLAGNVHSPRDSLGLRLQLSMQQAGVSKVSDRSVLPGS